MLKKAFRSIGTVHQTVLTLGPFGQTRTALNSELFVLLFCYGYDFVCSANKAIPFHHTIIYARTHTHVHTHVRMHARTNAYTHICTLQYELQNIVWDETAWLGNDLIPDYCPAFWFLLYHLCQNTNSDLKCCVIDKAQR